MRWRQLSSSAIGGIIGAIALFRYSSFAPACLILGPPEFFMLVMVGVAMVGTLSGKPYQRNNYWGAGYFVSLVGVHVSTGLHRFTFDQLYLVDGLKLIPVTSVFLLF